MTSVNQLSASDQVIATLQANGKILATVSKNNFSSVNDVVKFLMSMAGTFTGLAKLSIRNKTQGWIMNLAMATKPRAPKIPAFAASAPADGRQYLIPW